MAPGPIRREVIEPLWQKIDATKTAGPDWKCVILWITCIARAEFKNTFISLPCISSDKNVQLDQSQLGIRQKK